METIENAFYSDFYIYICFVLPMSMISNNVLSLVNKCVLNPHKSNLKNIDLRGNCRSFFFTFFIYNFNLPRIFHFMDWCSVLLTFLYSFFFSIWNPFGVQNNVLPRQTLNYMCWSACFIDIYELFLEIIINQNLYLSF